MRSEANDDAGIESSYSSSSDEPITDDKKGVEHKEEFKFSVKTWFVKAKISQSFKNF